MKDKIYHWMLMKLPFWLMYKQYPIDSQHKSFRPRFGWSNQQRKESYEFINKNSN